MVNYGNSVYYDLVVPVPGNATVLKNGRVQIYDNFGGRQHRYSLGISAGEGEMHPNQRYVDLYTGEFLRRYPEKRELIHPPRLSVGLFALVLGISQSTGLYRLLVTAYGAALANAMLDYAMYDIISTDLDGDGSFASRMDRQMLFAGRPYEDPWYSRMFCHEMTDEQNALFCGGWLDLCLKRFGYADVLLSIDGFRMQGSSPDSMDGEQEEEPDLGTGMVSVLWVLCAGGEHKGVPLTYFVQEGRKVDAEALKEVAVRLKNHKVSVAGAVLDRDFCTAECFSELGQHIPCEIIMPPGTDEFTAMMDSYASVIFNHARYRLEGKPGKYAITAKEVRVPADGAKTACLCLVYDDNLGSQRRTAFLQEVERERDRLCKAAAEHPHDGGVSGKFAGILKGTGGEDMVGVDENALESELRTFGYSVLASTGNHTAMEMEEVCALREVAEKVFLEGKSQLGNDAGSGAESVCNRFFVCFVACILLSETVNVCQKHALDPDSTISGLDLLQYGYNGARYECIAGPTQAQAKVLSEFGITDEKMALLGEKVNERLTPGLTDHTWSMPEKKKAGRRPGSKSVSPLAEEAGVLAGGKVGGKLAGVPDADTAGCPVPAEEGITSASAREPFELQGTVSAPVPEGSQPPPAVPQKRKPGRPPGSKNKKTLAREKAVAERTARGETPVALPASSRGRPKTPATVQKEEKERQWLHKAEIAGVPLPDLPKRGRGQPSKEAAAKREEILRDWMARVEVEYSKALAERAAGAGSVP